MMNRSDYSTFEPGRQNLGELFHRAAMSMKRALHHQGHSQHAQKHVLALLSENGSLSQSGLREALHVRSASLSELLGKLEKHGFITRSRHPNDQRNVVITITEAGMNMARKCGDMWREPEIRELFASLTDDEKRMLESILLKLIEAWETKYHAASTQLKRSRASRSSSASLATEISRANELIKLWEQKYGPAGARSGMLDHRQEAFLQDETREQRRIDELIEAWEKKYGPADSRGSASGRSRTLVGRPIMQTEEESE
jgi:DNA-binding MarR family transcriptional regulator